jgi:UDP-glucose 4-epimerase
MQVCVKAKVAKVVFISSGGTVYGVPHTLPVKEVHAKNPISSYGIVKLAIEKYFHLFHHLYGLSYTILRPANPYGIRQNPKGEQGVVAVFFGCAVRGLPITVWGDGEVVRDYFFVNDLARAAVRAAILQTEFEIFNIGSGVGVSLNGLLEVMEHVVGKSLQVVHLPARPFDVPKLILDVSLAKKVLEWEAQTSLEDGFNTTWKWIRSVEW